MKKRIKNIRLGKLSFIFLVIIVVLIAYGQTLQMYFWQDDSALIFKLQNPEGAAGSFGEGIIGHGAYKYLVTPFVPFFPLFGKDPFGYFFIGFITYIIATYFFHRFVRELYGEIKYAYYSTLIFAAGYIGSDIMFRVINSWQTNFGLILAFLTFEQIVKFTKKKKKVHYFLAVFFYWAATEFVFIRSHSLIVPIVVLDALFLVNISKVTSLLKYGIRQIPFLFIFYFRYLTNEGFGGPGLVSLVNELVAGNVEILAPLFANIGNSVFAYPLQEKLLTFVLPRIVSDQAFVVSGFAFGLFSVFYLLAMCHEATKKKIIGIGILFLGMILNLFLYSLDYLWYRQIADIFSGALGIEFIVFSFTICIQNIHKNKKLSKVAFFAFIVIVTQVFGYYVQYPSAIWGTTHRYFSYVVIGFAIIFVSIIKLGENKKSKQSFLGKGLLIGILSMHLYFGFTYQANLVETRSKTTREFYTKLLTYVPDIEKGSGFYFDVSLEPPYPQRFYDFFSVGSMPESTALAMYYDVDRYDVRHLTDFNETVLYIANGDMEIDYLYSYYYGKNGLVDNTYKMRELLNNGSENTVFTSLSDVVAIPLVPVELKLTISAAKGIPPTNYKPIKYSLKEKLLILEYLKARNDYYAEVVSNSLSDWRFREVGYAVDKNITTTWQGHRIYWNEKGHEELIVDLGKVKKIGSVIWTNWKTSLAPVTYSIETSVDRKNWSVRKSVVNGPERKNVEQIVEKFAATDARYVRMVISKTQTDDSPSLLEFEVVEDRFNSISFAQAHTYYDDPLSLASNKNEWDILYEQAEPISFATISWKTDKGDIDKQSSSFPIVIDGKYHTYKIVIPAGGTSVDRFNIKFSIPISFEISNISVRSLSLNELISNDMIDELSSDSQ
ncbi:discoidin domain-containing protein [Candidatus Woesebacteria bacterium]|nr:MAG: discoidin domain-containing protein [Candidatus Woesebacteria bacterium]